MLKIPNQVNDNLTICFADYNEDLHNYALFITKHFSDHRILNPGKSINYKRKKNKLLIFYMSCYV